LYRERKPVVLMVWRKPPIMPVKGGFEPSLGSWGRGRGAGGRLVLVQGRQGVKDREERQAGHTPS